MISIPLFALFGEDALEFRLANSGAKTIVTDASGWEKLAKIRDRLPDLKTSMSSATTRLRAPNRSGRRWRRHRPISPPSIPRPTIPR